MADIMYKHLYVRKRHNCSNSRNKKATVTLSVTTVAALNIAPKETVVYTKQTQTSNSGGAERDGKFFALFRNLPKPAYLVLVFPLHPTQDTRFF